LRGKLPASVGKESQSTITRQNVSKDFMLTKFFRIFTLILMLLVSINLVKGQNREFRRISIDYLKNGDTTLIPNNAMVELCYDNDTIIIPVKDQQFCLADTINLRFSKLKLILSDQQLEIYIIGDDIFENVLEFGPVDGKLTISYFDNYDFAKSNYGEHINVKKQDFKSVTIWNYQWYFIDTFIFETN